MAVLALAHGDREPANLGAGGGVEPTSGTGVLGETWGWTSKSPVSLGVLKDLLIRGLTARHGEPFVCPALNLCQNPLSNGPSLLP